MPTQYAPLQLNNAGVDHVQKMIKPVEKFLGVLYLGANLHKVVAPKASFNTSLLSDGQSFEEADKAHIPLPFTQGGKEKLARYVCAKYNDTSNIPDEEAVSILKRAGVVVLERRDYTEYSFYIDAFQPDLETKLEKATQLAATDKVKQMADAAGLPVEDLLSAVSKESGINAVFEKDSPAAYSEAARRDSKPKLPRELR